MTCGEEPEIWIVKTHELLSKAQLLMRDIEKLLDWCTSEGPSNQRTCRMIQQECQASIEEDGETLVIEGFRFENVASKEDLMRRIPQAGARGIPGHHMTDGYLSGFITQVQQGQTTGRGNNGRERTNK